MHLGIDLGTSGLRGILIDDDQNLIAEADAPLTVSRPHPGWSEQRAEDWIAAAEALLGALAASHPAALAAARSIGLSGQMHGATLIDRADRPLRPCILWNDVRSHAEAARLDADPAFRAITGNMVFPGFTAPKLVWAARHEPAAFAATDCVLLPKDFLRLWLTGERISEMSDASGTAWLDVGARDWSDDLLGRTGLSRAQMPALVEGSAPGGALRAAVATRFGMTPGIPVAGGGGDNAASAIGVGTVAEGEGFVSLGTSGVVFAAGDRFRPAPASAAHAFCHALPGAWHQMGVILSAASALAWWSGIAGESPAALTAALGETPAAPGSCLFLPYLSGERTPHNDSTIRGAFAGLSHETDRAGLTAAVLWGVAFALRDNLDALAAAGSAPARLLAVGGGSRSGWWLQAIADALNIPVDLPQKGDFGAALGAARLGMLAESGANPASVCIAPPLARSFEPAPERRAAVEEALGRWRALYPALRDAAA